MYELEIEGKPFSAKWEQVKASKTFDWESKDKKHDPYDVREFGDPVYSNDDNIDELE
jgi:hypothetical protein